MLVQQQYCVFLYFFHIFFRVYCARRSSPKNELMNDEPLAGRETLQTDVYSTSGCPARRAERFERPCCYSISRRREDPAGVGAARAYPSPLKYSVLYAVWQVYYRTSFSFFWLFFALGVSGKKKSACPDVTAHLPPRIIIFYIFVPGRFYRPYVVAYRNYPCDPFILHFTALCVSEIFFWTQILLLVAFQNVFFLPPRDL